MRYVLAPVLAPLMILTPLAAASAETPQQAQQLPQQAVPSSSLGTPCPMPT
ncbi:hypothetical protein [Novosphingobium sp. 9]|uniref:hypothetical protein n=1 Tax=Novosphingobium sp. 9 TaxID=2025349 RepID=UPI0021B61F8D|nr:hypothetical protein [Novosphingobium sp. 9]